MPTSREQELLRAAAAAGIDPNSLSPVPPEMTVDVPPPYITRAQAQEIPSEMLTPREKPNRAMLQDVRHGATAVGPDPEAVGLDPYAAVGNRVATVARNQPTDSERVKGEQAKTDERVGTDDISMRNPSNYDALADLQRRFTVNAVGAMVPGHMQPERVTTQQESGVPIPEDAAILNKQGFENRIESAAKQKVANEAIERTRGIAAEHAALADKVLLSGESEGQREAAKQREGALQKVQAALDALDHPIESPTDKMAKWGAGKRIGFMLASMLGGAAGARTGQNPFLQSFDRQLEADMATEKLNAEQRGNKLRGAQSLYELIRQHTQSDAEARAVQRAMFWKGFASTVERTAAQMGVTLNDARFNDLKASIDERYRDALMDMAKTSTGKTTVQKSVKYVPPQFISMAAKATGLKPADADAKIKDYIEYREKVGLPEMDQTLDLMRSALKNMPDSDVKRFYQQQLATNPAMPFGSLLRNIAASDDPQAKKFMSAIASAFSTSVRAAGGKALTRYEALLKQMELEPAYFAEWYNNLASEYNRLEGEARTGLGVYGQRLVPIIDQLNDYHRNAPNTTSRAVGAEVLPEAVPRVR